MGKVLKTYPYIITSPYGQRGNSFHSGVDITGYNNGVHVLDYICAKDKGTVVAMRNNCTGFEAGGSYGNYVIIDHGSGYKTVYAHMAYNSVRVNVGDTVSEGQVIGYMGNTGTSYGGHLHFEVRLNNQRINPTEYLDNELPLDEAPKPGPVGKFNIGDKVYIEGPLYTSSNASSPAGNTAKKLTNITRVNPGSAHPYNTTGDLGWMDESSITKYSEPVSSSIEEGDTVTVTGIGCASSDGSGAKTRYFKNQKMKVIAIKAGANYPYALNQFNDSSVRDYSKVTAWFDKKSITK